MISQETLKGVFYLLFTSAATIHLNRWNIWWLEIQSRIRRPIKVLMLECSSCNTGQSFISLKRVICYCCFQKCFHFPPFLCLRCVAVIWSLEQLPSTPSLYDPDIDWLLNTLLCMFYEHDGGGASTSEPVVCHWSQRMCSLSRSYLSVTLSRLKLFIFFLF